MKDLIPLLLRVFVLYPLAGLAAMLPSVTFDQGADLLIVDLEAASLALGGLIFAAISGGTFAWSRRVKKAGGTT